MGVRKVRKKERRKKGRGGRVKVTAREAKSPAHQNFSSLV